MSQPSSHTAPPSSCSEWLACSWQNRDEVPPLRQPGVGPVTRKLRRRAMLAYFCLCLLGSLPSLLNGLELVTVPPGLQVAGWGLWLPGAGFFAAGGGWIALFVVTLILFRLTELVWTLTGMLALPVLLWLGTAVASGFAAGTEVNAHTIWVVPTLVLAIYLRERIAQASFARDVAAARSRRQQYLQEALSKQEQRRHQALAARAESPRELDSDALAAARYVFRLALQPVGELAGFTRIDNIQAAALRYQLNHISYGLAEMQCHYTPNFHGYLNRAQRFAIESLTLPEVCGYWKYEYASGNFGWNPDPIGTRDNVMLTGWSLIPLATYAANTGDLRYQQDGALAFRPFKNGGKRYPHDAHSFVRSILDNWQQSVCFLYPCEPHWAFPICNALAWSGLHVYDRCNGSARAQALHGSFMRALSEEFETADGGIHAFLSSLTGLQRFSRGNPALNNYNLLSLSAYMSALHPGLTRRCYAFYREENLRVEDGLLRLPTPWEKEIDMGKYARNPSYTLAAIALAAAEHGDREIVDAALATSDKLLSRMAGDDCLAYEDISTTANIKLANARWAGLNDWHDMIMKGPSAAALRGPVLDDCGFPEVLVAQAVSNDGRDLSLVLYNGVAPGPQSIGLVRLQPDCQYHVEGATLASVRTDSKGTAKLEVVLNGRTAVTIRPLA